MKIEKKDKRNREYMELRSEQVQDILTRPPKWIVRWGISVICGIILFCFIGSFFFYYPEVIQAEVTVTTQNPPTWIIARNTGLLKERYKQDKEPIHKGELVAVLENPARTIDVLKLKLILNKGTSIDNGTAWDVQLPEDLSLGMIQGAYSTLQKAVNDYRSFESLDLYGRKIDAAERQLKGYALYLEHLKNQVTLSKKTAQIVENDFLREKKLYEENLTSLVTLEESDKTLLSAKQNVEQLQTSISSANIEMAKLQSALVEMLLQQQQEMAALKTNLKLAWNDLGVGEGNLEIGYALRSTSAGILSYNEIWKENQNVEAGDKVFSVVSTSPGKIIGRLKIPVEGAGKVKKGHRVNIKVDGFPYMEYGMLTGRVETVSLLSDDEVYPALVNLPHRMETSYHKILPFNGEITGTAEIITDEMSLAQRILNPIKYVFKKNFIK